MSLPTEAKYDDINGLEAMSILHSRFWDLLQQIPEFQERFALTRVVLRLEIVLDIWGAASPRKVIHDKFEMTSSAPSPTGFVPIEAHHTLAAEADSRSNPPDLIREEHGLPIPTAIRGPSGFLEDEPQLSPVPAKYPQPPKPIPSNLLPANQPNPNARQIGKRKYAAFVDQDYGAFVTGERDMNEPPVIGGEKITSTGGSSGHAPVQPDFRLADHRSVDPDKAKQILQDTIERGRQIDEEWDSRLQPFDEGHEEGAE